MYRYTKLSTILYLHAAFRLCFIVDENSMYVDDRIKGEVHVLWDRNLYFLIFSNSLISIYFLVIYLWLILFNNGIW